MSEIQIIPQTETPKSYKESLETLTMQLTDFKLSEVAGGKANEERMILYESESLLSLNDCIYALPIFQVKKQIQEGEILKIVVFVIWSYQKSLKYPEDRIMDATDLTICVGDFIDTYTHDSVEDLIFALRQARHDGKTFYNKFSQQDLNLILREHFDRKSKAVEFENSRIISIEPIKSLKIGELMAKALQTPDPLNGEDYTTFKAREKCRQMIENPKPSLIPRLSEAEWEALAAQSLAYFSLDENL